MIRRIALASLLLAAVTVNASAQDATQAAPSGAVPTTSTDPAVANPAASPAAPASEQPMASPAPVAQGPQLQIIDHVVGKGREALPGNTVVVNYTGWLYKPLAAKGHGKKFDSSLDAGREPLEFKLGARQVIKGWDQGVAGMKIGGKRTLIIPSELAYGRRGSPGVIPPDADLTFDVELLQVK